MATEGPRLDKRVYWALRIGTAMCFIGHGAFGIITKTVWLNYFEVFGIAPALGWKLMPLVGTFDIALGLSLLLYPTRAVWGWLMVWGTATALLRPLSGEPFAEAVERAGNYGMPLAMLLMVGFGHRVRDWFTRVGPDQVCTRVTAERAVTFVRVFAFMLLAGHGWLNLLHKPALVDQYASIGITDPAGGATIIGLFEVTAAFAVLVKPIRSVILALLVWKMASELLYPKWEIFEWIERGGSYAALLVMWLTLPHNAQRSEVVGPELGAGVAV